MLRPSEERLLRYPDTDGYYRLNQFHDERYPRQCIENCPIPCAGGCSCIAYQVAAIDVRFNLPLRLDPKN